MLTPGSPPAHATPALVARAQGGLTLAPERGDLGAEKYYLGMVGLALLSRLGSS